MPRKPLSVPCQSNSECLHADVQSSFRTRVINAARALEVQRGLENENASYHDEDYDRGIDRLMRDNRAVGL